MGKNDNDYGIGGILLGAAAVAGLFGIGARKIKSTAGARVRRREIPIQWTAGLSQELFQKFCMESAKGIRRLKILSIDGLNIKNVRSKQIVGFPLGNLVLIFMIMEN